MPEQITEGRRSTTGEQPQPAATLGTTTLALDVGSVERTLQGLLDFEACALQAHDWVAGVLEPRTLRE